MDTNWERVLKDCQLISLPEVYLKLQQLLADDDYALDDIAQVIGFDPAITARLLRMVNSSFFGLAANIETVNRAINYLGAQQVHDLVLSTSIAQTFAEMNNDAFNLHQFWQRSVFCAIAAREIAVICNVLDSERLFVIGLLHDIGHLMMYQSIPDLTRQAEQIAIQKKLSVATVENRLIGFDFAKAGSALLQNWNLPASLVQSIQHQNTPSSANDYQLETSILHLSALLTRAFEQDIAVEKVLADADSNALILTNFSIENAAAISAKSGESLNSVFNLLFPQLQAGTS